MSRGQEAKPNSPAFSLKQVKSHEGSVVENEFEERQCRGGNRESCSLTHLFLDEGNPPASYQWFKNGEENSLFNGPVLNIDKSKVEDSGEYYCEATNEVATLRSDTLSLDFIGKLYHNSLLGPFIMLAFCNPRTCRHLIGMSDLSPNVVGNCSWRRIYLCRCVPADWK